MVRLLDGRLNGAVQESLSVCPEEVMINSLLLEVYFISLEESSLDQDLGTRDLTGTAGQVSKAFGHSLCY